MYRLIQTLFPSKSTVSFCIYVSLFIIITILFFKVSNVLIYKHCFDTLQNYRILSYAKNEKELNKVFDYVRGNIIMSSSVTTSHLLTNKYDESDWLKVVSQSLFMPPNNSKDLVARRGIASGDNNALFNAQNRSKVNLRTQNKEIAFYNNIIDYTTALFSR